MFHIVLRSLERFMLSVRQRGILTEAEVTDVSIKNKKNLIAPAHIYPLELDFQITLR